MSFKYDLGQCLASPHDGNTTETDEKSVSEARKEFDIEAYRLPECQL
jgi:hypothetical protein